MELPRDHLTMLLNALYDSGTTRFTVDHPSPTVGSLFEVDLGDPLDSTVRVKLDGDAYREVRADVNREFGSPVVDELPSPRSYVNAFVAGGLLDFANREDLDSFLDRNGSPDLTAGHRPVLAGFDTNLLPWRPADALGLEAGQNGTVNGFALATGVRDEIDWDYKRQNTRPLTEAFGDEFDAFWNQPAGANREGRLGQTAYRSLRDHRHAEEVVTDTGDDAIVDGYDAFQTDGRKDVVLFSNDRNFIERAHSHRIPAQEVLFPDSLPRSVTGSWTEIQDTLYTLTVLFGVLVLPKVTLYGVWRGKDGAAWHTESMKLDCRSPKIKSLLERDLTIIDAYENA